MPKLGYKTPISLLDEKSARSIPRYARSSIESRNKEKKRFVSTRDKKERISPLKSPRLCQDSPQVTDWKFETRVDSGSCDHERSYSAGFQPSNKTRNESHKPPKDCIAVGVERLENDRKEFKSLLAEREKEMEELNDRSKKDKKPYKEHLISKHKEIDKLQGILDNDHRNCKKHLSMKDKEIERLKGMIEDLSIKYTNLSKDRTVSERKVNELSKVVEEKETELMRKHLERSEKKVLELSKEINVIKVSQQQTADEKLQTFQEENSSLQSALLRATTRIEDLSNKCTDLQKYRTDAEHKLSKLSKAVKEKENEIGSLKKDLERIEELSVKCTNLLIDRGDAERKANKLSKVVDEKEFELELLSRQLARSEEKVSELSKEINVMKVSHRQTADEKLHAFQKERAYLQSALSKASTQNDDLSNKCTNLQKYKTDAEHKLSKLSKAVKEKENKIGSLKKDQESYDQLRRHYNELRREKDHDLNRSSSGAEGNGKRDHKGLM